MKPAAKKKSSAGGDRHPSPTQAPPAEGLNNVITASRMLSLSQCPRKHFWSYEIGLRKTEEGLALRIGSAWARAMESRWNGKTYEQALSDAIPVGTVLDDYSMATVSALLAAYYEVYGPVENYGKIYPEVQFRSQIENGFTAEGKMDGLGTLADGRSVIIESKTTSDSIAPDSGYWQRLSFNLQVLQYIIEARKIGWDVSCLFYDVTRKPMIQPKEINDLDEDGKKIVVDLDGERVFKKDGTPRESADSAKGYTVKSHTETPDEFCDRLYKDALSRPDFYFCRREVPVIEQDLESFVIQRRILAGIIKYLRFEEFGKELWKGVIERNPEAWPRNVSEHTCDFCQFKTFCLQNLSVNVNNPPEGFSVQPFNPELKTKNETN